MPGASLETNARLAHALLHYEDASLVGRAIAIEFAQRGERDPKLLGRSSRDPGFRGPDDR